MLHHTLTATIPEALKAKDKVRLRTVRGIVTAITNELVAMGKTPQDTLDDQSVIAVIGRLAKQRRDSLVQYEAAGRTSLAEREKEELVVLESYLPARMSHEEIFSVAQAKKAELGIEDASKTGVLIGAVMKELKGKADGAQVKTVVQSLFT